MQKWSHWVNNFGGIFTVVSSAALSTIPAVRIPGMPPLTHPLTDAELERLEELLYRFNPDEAMSLEELDGFFCALICSPELVPFSEFMPLIFGGDSKHKPDFSTVEEAQELLNLLTRHWNTIAGTLFRNEQYPVLLGAGSDGTVTGQEWALGFMQGMTMRPRGWERLGDDKQFASALLPVIVLAEDDDHGLTAERATQEEREQMLDVLSASVSIVYSYFRSEVKPRRTPRKRPRARKV
jgi:uncharacterized protein